MSTIQNGDFDLKERMFRSKKIWSQKSSKMSNCRHCWMKTQFERLKN